MLRFLQYYQTSLGKKQIVASTGLFLILFVIVHLAGNLFIFGGPDIFNAYAKKIAGLRPFLYLLELGLLFLFLLHLYTTTLLVLENIQSRGISRYSVYQPVGQRSWATRLMPYTGLMIFAFVIWHLLDFTFVDHQGPRSILKDGQSYGLYGVVYNAFSDPLHSFLYIIAMIAVGLHFNHGIQSFFQTFGWLSPSNESIIKKISHFSGTMVALVYSMLPIHVLLDYWKS